MGYPPAFLLLRVGHHRCLHLRLLQLRCLLPVFLVLWDLLGRQGLLHQSLRFHQSLPLVGLLLTAFLLRPSRDVQGYWVAQGAVTHTDKEQRRLLSCGYDLRV